MSLEKASEIVNSIEDLPTLPEVVIGITQLVDDPDATAEDIYRIVSTDPSLSATMLKLVNSAFYGMSRSVTSLEQAIRILGFVTVRNIALAAFVFDAFVVGKGQFDYKGFWMHSIGSAAAAKILAQRMRIKESGECFVYGLLHDLGIVVMMQYLSDQMTRIVGLVDEGKSLDRAEKKVMGCTHRDIGAALAGMWDFPPALVSTMRYHGLEEIPEEFERETALTTCGSTIATALEIGETAKRGVSPVPEAVWRMAAVEPEDIGAIMDDVLREMDNSRSFVSLLYT
ncbi:MAG: HDOD domain-containing protein [Planctomycetota bacterium]|jgi:HD-like signal output (HDOD) protein